MLFTCAEMYLYATMPTGHSNITISTLKFNYDADCSLQKSDRKHLMTPSMDLSSHNYWGMWDFGWWRQHPCVKMKLPYVPVPCPVQSPSTYKNQYASTKLSGLDCNRQRIKVAATWLYTGLRAGMPTMQWTCETKFCHSLVPKQTWKPPIKKDHNKSRVVGIGCPSFAVTLSRTVA